LTEVRRRKRRAAFPAGLFDALIQQESGGNGEAVSSAGALGSTQMLPNTAREMAQKLGLPFRPDLLRSKAPEALQYQRALGRAYLEEGMAKTGNVRDALHYYHGGPDRSQWGPKTHAYANSILSRLGGR
jgi:soluble lytic murein transglycosylase